MRGRKPTPTNMRLLKGNPGKRALPKNEAKPELPSALDLHPPEHLSETAKKEWLKLAPRLQKHGLLTELDLGSLEMYCVQYGRWVDAELVLKKTATVGKSKKGDLIYNPHWVVANRAWQLLLKMAAEFGMTPSSRSRVQAANDPDAHDPFKQLFG